MMPKKFIYLVSKNVHKYAEYKRFFSNYNVEIKRITEFEYSDDTMALLQSFSDSAKENYCLGLMADETSLYLKKNHEKIIGIDDASDLREVYTRTRLFYLSKEEENIYQSSETEGIIDFSKRKNAKKAYGWDDIFIHPLSGLTLQELRKRKMKNHGRQEVLSFWVKDHLYYEDNIDLNFNPQNQEDVIELSANVWDFIHEHPLLNSIAVKKRNLFGIFSKAIANGGFFRSPSNRRQKNYWAPGLNAGIPLVPKKDAIHELTFFVHDLCHFALPDLIYSGENNPLLKRVYILRRMMSEAFTLVLADMYFIDALVEEGVEYDFTKRKIYPLYSAIKKNNRNASLKDVLYAMTSYCLLGEEAELKLLVGDGNVEILSAFKEKYERFFIEDFRWTAMNFDNMSRSGELFSKWYKENHSLMNGQGLIGIKDYFKGLPLSGKKEISNEELMELIFQEVFDVFSGYIQENEKPKQEKVLSDSRKKYFIGQMMLLYKFDFIPLANFVKEKLQSVLSKEIISEKDVELLRGLYNRLLLSLEEDYNLINKDDVETYKEVYPVFDSFYVFYDREKENFASLKSASGFYLS